MVPVASKIFHQRPASPWPRRAAFSVATPIITVTINTMKRGLMNSPAAWTRGGFGVAPKAFLARRPTAPGREASCVLCDLPRREFGPFRPYTLRVKQALCLV